MSVKPVLLIGGHGIAGRKTALQLRRRHPDLPLAIAGIVASVIGAFYYIAVIKTMYFDDKSEVEFGTGGVVVEDAVITASALWLSVVGYFFIPVLAVVSATAAAVLF